MSAVGAGLNELTLSQKRIITDYGFDVSLSGSMYVVRHPNHKKLGKLESHNLDEVLTTAAEYVDKYRAARPNGHKKPAPVQTNPDDPEPDEIDGGELDESGETVMDEITGGLDDSGGRVRKPAKVKAPPRDKASLKTFQIIKHWLLHPNDTPEKLIKTLGENGVVVLESTVVMLRAATKQVCAVQQFIEAEKNTNTTTNVVQLRPDDSVTGVIK